MIARTAADIISKIQRVEGCNLPDNASEVEEALVQAVRSLDAWEKAIEDINAAIMSDRFCRETEMGLSLAEDIIRYHLGKLETEDK